MSRDVEAKFFINTINYHVFLMYYRAIDLEWFLFFVALAHSSFQSAIENILYRVALAQFV